MFNPLPSTRLPCGNRVLVFDAPKVMGILNVTPDSFSDGGRYTAVESALRHAEGMVSAGAAIIDVGGESTRPGAPAVSEAEELDRVVPVIEAIARELDVVISMDTSTPAVMREGARAGAGLINDVRSLRRPGALETAAATDLAICLMHMRGEPGTMQQAPVYADVAGEVGAFLAEQVARCEAVGISRQRLVLDPGYGFAKTLEHNLELFRRQAELLAFGLPLLVGVSRKSMIGAVTGRPVEGRLAGGLALAALALAKGAQILRVHDVAETVDVVKMITAVEGFRQEQN
ncbi:dihydropteroate synthase [Pseudomonas sp. HR1]|uniref:Dihydropteroate synthase n=1 Tax=Pseudomonas oryzihabitans TaxID=47885 RepID=A0ABX3IMA1_9PSED|nr:MULTISPECIES: dihydropteroate synthase [Pseudomonas]KIZ48962.1 dihydropteroate synthase [Pseudomonas oryzihabitans]MDK4201993.1 dihydropteroate synthase [Pseudomonas sp. HR1]ONN68905.1 dihydropteroate synthase [Pseudomonas psychrotolerans]